MYATSSQKRHWTFSSPAHLAEQRAAVNARFISRHEPYVDNPSQLSEFLTSDDEVLLCRVVSETGSRFSKDFQPSLPLPVRWISFMYFKRFYTKCSALAYAPKNIMMACFFLAAKVYEFNITTRQFVSNLRSGTPESNIEFILKLEPKLMEELDYELTVHTPYKAFEGHLIEMKTRMPLLGFDLEQLRPFAYQFFEKALITDAMLLYAPTHIALAALKYALEKADKSLEILRDFFYKFLDLDHFNSRDEDKEQVEKLIQRVTEIYDMVLLQIQPLSPDASTALKVRIHNFSQLLNTFEERMRGVSTEQEDVYMSDSD